MIIDISSETIQVRKQWSGFFKVVESINPQFYMRKNIFKKDKTVVISKHCHSKTQLVVKD